MVTSPPSRERMERLLEQIGDSGPLGMNFAVVHHPHVATIPARQGVSESFEAPEGLPHRQPQPQGIETCACGKPTAVVIGYTDEDGAEHSYRACAICDGVHLQPRFTDSRKDQA